MVDLLVNTYSSTGIKSYWSNIFKISKQIHQIVFAISLFETANVSADYSLERYFGALRNTGYEPFLDTYIRRRIENRFTFPTSQLKDVIYLIENRRSRTVESLIILIAAILGGIIGAVFTLIATTW